MLVQDYLVRLADGREILLAEPVCRPWQDTFWGRYVYAGPDDRFRVTDDKNRERCFPAADVVQIFIGLIRDEPEVLPGRLEFWEDTGEEEDYDDETGT